MFTLFPFLSVVGCAMGVLVVVISSQSLLAVKVPNMVIRVPGAQHGRQPVYVECDAAGLIVHPQRTRVPMSALRRDADSAFHALMNDLEISEDTAAKKYLVLLVRPEGVKSYQRAIDLAQEVWMRVKVGKDVIPPGGGRLTILAGETSARLEATAGAGGKK